MAPYRKSLREAALEEPHYFVHDYRVLRRWDIPEKVVIGVAPSGRSLTDEHVPGYPQTPDEFSQAAIEVVGAGCPWVHWDFNFVTAENELRIEPTAAYARSIEAVRRRFGRAFVSDTNVLFGKTFEENLGPIISGVAETTPLGLMHPGAWVREAVAAVQEAGAVVQITAHDPGEIGRAHDLLIAPGLVRKPYFWLILIGLPRELDRLPRPTTHLPSSDAMISTLQLMVRLIRDIDASSFICVCAAGRASHYMAVQAMLMGLHVRVGLEDTCWRYPHRDEQVDSNLEMYQRAVDSAHLLGRTVATADEFREMVGIGG